MKKISADLIVTHTSDPVQDGVIVYDERTGVIEDVLTSKDGIDDIEIFRGVIIPGYVNAHCHLELSHLKDVIPTGTGLIPFIKSVVSLRDFPQEEIDAKIIEADRYMSEVGIVAVGDISNQVDTVSAKSSSDMRYYTFVEMFDLLQEGQAGSTFENYYDVYEAHLADERHKKSIVPHAPYSVSNSLWDLVVKSHQSGETISMHNQELKAENELFAIILKGN